MDAEVRQGNCLARALLVEAVTAVSAVVFAIRESKGSSASHADVGINPFRRLSISLVSRLFGGDHLGSWKWLTALLSIMLLATD